MISKAKAKYIKSLQVKKYRKQEQRFVVEGAKGVQELLASDFITSMVCGTAGFLDKHAQSIPEHAEVIEATPEELAAVSDAQTNDAALAIAEMKFQSRPVLRPNEFVLVLDDIRDPGNLGTIIRTADWYNITNIIASEETADMYSPKVIRATMGSFCRVNVFYTSLADFLKETKCAVYGTFLGGTDIHEVKFAEGGMIVIGNESNGISKDVEKFVTKKITIPKHGRAESLNASIATAIVLDNVVRHHSTG